MNPSAIITWIGAICTFGILTVLYKENKVFRFFEHVFIGVATGYEVLQLWRQTLKPNWYEPMIAGQWYWMFAAVAGALYFTIYSARFSWMSKLVIGALLGVASGQIFAQFVGEVVPQMRANFAPIIGHGWPDGINRTIFLGILICVMTYFFFSFEHRNPAVRGGARAGRWLLMISFGAVFGNTVMARFSLFISRLQFLVTDWWPLLKFW